VWAPETLPYPCHPFPTLAGTHVDARKTNPVAEAPETPYVVGDRRIAARPPIVNRIAPCFRVNNPPRPDGPIEWFEP